MASDFFFSLDSIKSKKNNTAGQVIYVTSDKVPGFVNISYSNLTLNPKGSLEPIWHTNANKIGYCTEGNHLVRMRTPDLTETFTVKEGELFFIPKGYIHHIENIGNTKGVIHFALNNGLPETMELAKAIYSLNEHVFESTFGPNSSSWDTLKKTKKEELIKTLSKLEIPPAAKTSKYKFNIEDSKKIIQTKGGYLQNGTKANLPVLDGLGILGFGLNPQGIVEPHWHTNAGELVFIVKGKTRITVLSPDGRIDVMDVKAGEGAFAPASYFHNIENTGSENVEVIAFFNDAQPDYMGIGEVMSAFSKELLASVFNTSVETFNALHIPDAPLVIGPK
jgi:oxalate decarboxylase